MSTQKDLGKNELLRGGVSTVKSTPVMHSNESAKPKAQERHCWNCGDSMGVIENRYYDRSDTCGKSECQREAQNQARAERDEAHEQLDRDLGW